MTSNRGLWFLLGLVAGILIGFFLIPHHPTPPPPHPNTLSVNILPGGVQLAPNKGDKIVWRLGGKIAEDVHIHFYGDSPCEESGDGHTCTVTASTGQFMYFCSDKVDPNDRSAKILCLDPGVDPNSSVGDGISKLLRTENVVYAAQKTKTPEKKQPEKSMEAAITTPIPPTNLSVVCRNNTVTVLNSNTTPPNTNSPTVKVGGLVQWNSSLDPVIRIDGAKCDGGLGDHPPTCTVKSTGDISYTIEVSKDKCSNAPPQPFHINVVNMLKNCDY